MSEKIYRADFLWLLCEDGNIQEAGYEFANGLSQEYQEQWWNILVERIRARALADAVTAVEKELKRWEKVEAAYPRGCPLCLFGKAIAAITALEGKNG